MSLEGFNLNRFDDADLWRQSKVLMADLPGLHVTKITQPTEVIGGYWMTNGHLRVENDSPIKVHLGEAVYKGTEEEIIRLYDQAVDSMGSPKPSYMSIHDANPGAAIDPARQVQAAQAFLPFLKHVALTGMAPLRADEPPLARCLEFHFYGESMPNRETVQKLATINVFLAHAAGQNAVPYQEIQDRTASWTPERNQTALSWL